MSVTAPSFEETYFAVVRTRVADALAERVSARAAFQETLWGDVLLVDIRTDDQRREEGELPGSVVIDRFLLEWRLDPRSETRLPQTSYDARVLVIGDELTAARAARDLRELGLARAAHVSGGFAAWRDAGMPVSRGR